MREQLIQYVNLLFAGAADCDDIRQEILQNTLDRYDDLIELGKSPEAAYRLAITGIGDINEILSTPREIPAAAPEEKNDADRRKHAVSIAMYILCPIPLFIFSEFGLETLGLCLTLLLVAAATALRLTMRRTEKAAPAAEPVSSPREKLHSGVDSLIWALGLALYLVISFSTGAWYITWVMFPLIGAVQGLINAILDLKEEN